MTAKRRKFTDAKRRKILAYHQEHGHTATLKRFNLASSVLSRMKQDAAKARTAVFGEGRLYARRKDFAVPEFNFKGLAGKQRANGLEAVTLLRQAWRLIQAERGAALTDADLYVKLALNHLTQARKEGA